MIYNSKLIDKEVNDYRKVTLLLGGKKYIFYCLIAFLLSRINIIFYMAPIGVAFSLICLLKGDKFLGLLVCLSSMIGYFTTRDLFITFNLYVFINLIFIPFNFLDIKVNFKKIVLFSLCSIAIFVYKYFFVGFSLLSGIFSMTLECGIIFALYFIFNNFIKVMNSFSTNQIFTKEEVICLVITVCLTISGFNNIKIFGLDISNILLVLFVLTMSYINGISIGMISAVFSGGIIGITKGEFTEYIALYSIISCVSSLFYLSSRFAIGLLCSISILILKLSTISFLGVDQNLLFLEILIAILIFVVLPGKVLNKILIHFNEEHRREFYTQKRLFNTLDMRLEKINDFNDIIKQLSDMIVSNVNFKYKMLDKKIYVEILAESVCGDCSRINLCWKNNFKKIREEVLVSLENFIQGEKTLTKYIERNCIKKEEIMGELSKISNFYNMQKTYENKIYEAQDILSYELKNLHNIINQGIKEVKKDIVIKVNYEKSLINKFLKFKIKYFDLVCYEENGRVKVKVILPYQVYCEYKLDILDIVNLALPKKMMLQEESSKYINMNDEIILNYVEKYDYNIISHCLQLSKGDKNGDSYVFSNNPNDNYVIILSDGIGSGREAYDKSKFTVDLIHKFIKTSLSLSSCIKEIISIISLKFFRDESISTIDFGSIDLYTGKMNYLKFSSVITYIKRGEEVFTLESDRDLFNEFNENNHMILTGEFQLKYGDILVHLTDGLIHFKDLSHKAWLYNFLKRCDIISPDKLCEEIIREFKLLNNGSFQDDVTVIVSKVYKNCD